MCSFLSTVPLVPSLENAGLFLVMTPIAFEAFTEQLRINVVGRGVVVVRRKERVIGVFHLFVSVHAGHMLITRRPCSFLSL